MALAAFAVSLGIGMPASPALADSQAWRPAHKQRMHKKRTSRPRATSSMYDSRGRYRTPQRMSRSDRIWRGNDGRYYCRRKNGTTGLVIGAAVGGLAGHEIAGHGDKTLGTVIGAVGGGLLGRSVDRGNVKCR